MRPAHRPSLDAEESCRGPLSTRGSERRGLFPVSNPRKVAQASGQQQRSFRSHKGASQHQAPAQGVRSRTTRLRSLQEHQAQDRHSSYEERCPFCNGRGLVQLGTGATIPCPSCQHGAQLLAQLDQEESSKKSEEQRALRAKQRTNRLKVCSLCGKTGHNRLGCPKNPAVRKAALQKAQAGKKEPGERRVSRFRGVSWFAPEQRWRVQLGFREEEGGKYRVRVVGTFEAEEDAARAYDEAAVGERGAAAYRLLNFPEEYPQEVPLPGKTVRGRTSRFRGVSWYRSSWRAQLGYLDEAGVARKKHLGMFGTEEEAARAYDRAALAERGELACLNFPEEAGPQAPQPEEVATRLEEASSPTTSHAVPVEEASPAAEIRSSTPGVEPSAAFELESVGDRGVNGISDTSSVSSRAGVEGAVAAGVGEASTTDSAAEVSAAVESVSVASSVSDNASEVSSYQPSTAEGETLLSADGVSGSGAPSSSSNPSVAVSATSGEASLATGCGSVSGASSAADSAESPSPSRAREDRRVQLRQDPTKAALKSVLAGLQPAGSRPRAPVIVPLPDTVAAQVQAAASAVLAAHRDGLGCQLVQLPLPQVGRLAGFALGEWTGWPGGIAQQFSALQPVVEAILRTLKQEPSLKGRLEPRWLDRGDRCCVWEGPKLAAVLFPTADQLDQILQIYQAGGEKRLLLVINPQWVTDGQIVSDFGFGRNRREGEAFLRGLQATCATTTLRIAGDDVCVHRAYPSAWQVHYVWPNRRGHLLAGVQGERPSYEQLAAILRSVPGSRSARSWLDRVNPFGSGEYIPGLDDHDPEPPVMLDEDSSSSSAFLPEQLSMRGLQESGAGRRERLRQQLEKNGSLASTLSTIEGSIAEPEPSEEVRRVARKKEAARVARDQASRDRFGLGRDNLSGRPLERDVKLEPVRALAEWQSALFGSKGGGGESMDVSVWLAEKELAGEDSEAEREAGGRDSQAALRHKGGGGGGEEEKSSGVSGVLELAETVETDKLFSDSKRRGDSKGSK